MKLTKLHLIIILALALILCPILGVCYNSNSSINAYNYNEGFTPSGSGNKKSSGNNNHNKNNNNKQPKRPVKKI